MFEPENDIERLLMRASAEPAERPAFARALMDAEIFWCWFPKAVIRSSPGPTASRYSRGHQVDLAERGARRGKADSVLHGAVAGASLVQRTTTSWRRSGRAICSPAIPARRSCSIPAPTTARILRRARWQRLLAGDFDLSGPQAVTTQAPQQIMLAHPKRNPHRLDRGARRANSLTVKSVRGAWLMLAMRGGEAEQSWMLGVDHTGAWQEVRDAIGRAIVGDILGGACSTPCRSTAVHSPSTLRTGIPVTAAKRGFLH